MCCGISILDVYKIICVTPSPPQINFDAKSASLEENKMLPDSDV